MIAQQACLYAARLILTTQVHCVTAEHIMRCSKFCNKYDYQLSMLKCTV